MTSQVPSAVNDGLLPLRKGLLSNPASIARHCGPVCFRKYGPCGGRWTEPTVAPVPIEEAEVKPSPLERASSKIGGIVLRHVAVGLACGILPTACPAFVAINQIAGLAKTANDIYNAYTGAPDRSSLVAPGQTLEELQVADPSRLFPACACSLTSSLSIAPRCVLQMAVRA